MFLLFGHENIGRENNSKISVDILEANDQIIVVIVTKYIKSTMCLSSSYSHTKSAEAELTCAMFVFTSCVEFMGTFNFNDFDKYKII